MKKYVAWERFFIVLASAFLVIYCYAQYIPYSLAWNITASIPKGLYFSTSYAGAPLARGQIACFPYKAPAWAADRHYSPEGFQLCKHALGLPGDVVEVSGEQMRILHGNEVKLTAGLAKADSRGRPLPHDALTSGRVPQGHYLMIAPAHVNSLDSRYLGRIEQRVITRTLVPLVTW